MAPAGIFQSKSGEGGISFAVNSNGIWSKSMGLDDVAGGLGVCFGVFWFVSPVGVLLGCCGVCTLRAVEPPLMGRSLRAWKLRGLLPRTIIAPECTSHIGTLTPLARVAITFNRTTKCCCSSFLLPLFAVAIRNCSRFQLIGKLTYSESMSCPVDRSSGYVGGSFSVLSSVDVLPVAGVFHGTEIIFTGLPSSDSVAEMVSSWPRIGIWSPWSVMRNCRLRGIVMVPVIWKRFLR